MDKLRDGSTAPVSRVLLVAVHTAVSANLQWLDCWHLLFLFLTQTFQLASESGEQGQLLDRGHQVDICHCVHFGRNTCRQIIKYVHE